MSDVPIKEPILFNALALIFILILLPVSIALIADSAYEYEDENFSNAYNTFSLSGTANVAFIENGNDFSGSYDGREGFTGNEADCSYIVPTKDPYPISDRRYFSGSCEGDGVQGDFVGIGGNPLLGGMVKVESSTALGRLAGKVPQTHHLIEPNLNHGYVGGSGTSNFTWAYMMNTSSTSDVWALPNEQMGAFRIIKLDESTTYTCSDPAFFTELEFDYSLTLWYNEESLRLDFNDLQLNYITDASNPTQCYPSITLHYNFTGMQIVEISNFNNNDWYNTTILSTIDNIERTDGAFFGYTYLPFGGINEYTESFDYITIDDVDVKQGLSNIALILGFTMGALGLASTSYWNPIVNRFRGFKVD